MYILKKNFLILFIFNFLYKFNFMFTSMAPTTTGNIEEATQFVKEIVEKTSYVSFASSLLHYGRDVFFIADNNDDKYAIKILNEDSYNREVACFKLAKRIGLDDVVLSIEGLPTDSSDNKLIITPYCYFDETNKQDGAVSLYDIVYDKSKAYNNNVKNFWQSNAVNGKKQYKFSLLNQLNFEKALIFSFLTLQQDLNPSNVFLKKKVNPLSLEFRLFDFSYSMTETNIANRPRKTGVVDHYGFTNKGMFYWRKIIFKKI